MKVLYVTEYGQAVTYDPQTHETGKFIYWKEKIGTNGNGELLLIGSPDYRFHNDIKEAVRESPDRKPDSAGNTQLGYIIGWESLGFDVHTPDQLKDPITRALQLQDAVS
jgi:hypothetical protein